MCALCVYVYRRDSIGDMTAAWAAFGVAFRGVAVTAAAFSHHTPTSPATATCRTCCAVAFCCGHCRGVSYPLPMRVDASVARAARGG